MAQYVGIPQLPIFSKAPMVKGRTVSDKGRGGGIESDKGRGWRENIRQRKEKGEY